MWNDFDDINFDELPNQFVLKCNHGSGMNIICRDKKTFDKQRAREKIKAWLAVDYAFLSLELYYTRINRKIIVEKIMANGDAPDIDNYKFWCFNDELIFCGFDSGRTADGNIGNLRMDFFDMNWKPTNVERSDHPNISKNSSYCVRQKFQSDIKFPSLPEEIPAGKVIASLTSWTKRINTPHSVIQKILNQTRQPDLTVLYLAKEEFPLREEDLPRELLELRSELFEIHWTKNIRSYKKLIPALKDFPRRNYYHV